MIVVNLQQLGPVPPKFCDPEELLVVLAVAEEIMADTPEEALEEILIEWETALYWASTGPDPITEEWYYRALLTTCIRGLRGEMRPNFYSATK